MGIWYRLRIGARAPFAAKLRREVPGFRKSRSVHPCYGIADLETGILDSACEEMPTGFEDTQTLSRPLHAPRAERLHLDRTHIRELSAIVTEADGYLRRTVAPATAGSLAPQAFRVGAAGEARGTLGG
jgi:hypothetical protein